LSEREHPSLAFSGTFELRLYRSKSQFINGIYSANQKLLSSLLINVAAYAGSHISGRPFPVKGLSMTRNRTQAAGNSPATDRHLDIQPLFSTTSPIPHISTSVKVNCLLFISKRILGWDGGTTLFSRSCRQPGFQFSRETGSKVNKIHAYKPITFKSESSHRIFIHFHSFPRYN